MFGCVPQTDARVPGTLVLPGARPTNFLVLPSAHIISPNRHLRAASFSPLSTSPHLPHPQGQAYELLKMPFYALYYYRRAAQLKPTDARMWSAVAQVCVRCAVIPSAVPVCVGTTDARTSPTEVRVIVYVVHMRLLCTHSLPC